jgi:hypothetical protein
MADGARARRGEDGGMSYDHDHPEPCPLPDRKSLGPDPEPPGGRFEALSSPSRKRPRLRLVRPERRPDLAARVRHELVRRA